MPGGKGNIRPEDNPKPFTKGNKAAEKWTEEDALRLVNGLVNWMQEKEENIFYDEYLFLVADQSDYGGKIHADIIRSLSKRFSTFAERVGIAAKIEETKLKKYGAFDKLNASMTKFLLSANYGYKERTETDVNDKRDKKIEVEIVRPEKSNLKIDEPKK